MAIVAAAVGLAGCIVEFNPKLKAGDWDILVVEGNITDGQTVVSLSWSESLSRQIIPGLPITQLLVNGALVWVESEAGASFSSQEEFGEVEITDMWGNIRTRNQYTGRYFIETGTLDDNTRYRLRIEYDGNEYVSDWRAPQSTPPVEKLDISLDESSDMVQVRVDVTGEADGAQNYMWSYEETWQTRADISATHYFGHFEGEYLDKIYSYNDYQSDGSLSVFAYPGYRSHYYNCWKYGKSRELLIADTKKLTENSLRDHLLFEFYPGDDRLSVLYHIKLSQFAVADDAYQYYNTLKENTDNTGSIFAPIPSEMPGNLVCTTSPETYVIGFVEVSHAVVKEVFMYRNASPYKPPPTNCDTNLLSDVYPETGRQIITSLSGAGYTLVSDYSPGPQLDTESATFSQFHCVDCRSLGGTKRRPSWWPTPDQ